VEGSGARGGSTVTGATYVQYGCGWCAPEQWLNFDASPTLRFERLPLIGKIYTRNARRYPENVRYGDVARGLPLAGSSCLGVYCSHVLEHLSLEAFDRAIAETFRILAPGGIFRLVVPDLEEAAREYLEAIRHGDGTANSSFMRMTQSRRRATIDESVILAFGPARQLPSSMDVGLSVSDGEVSRAWV
jgi:SAM-dependent methyltransferase